MDRWACRGLALLASPGCSGSPDANSRLGRRCFRRRLKYHMTGGSLPLCHNSWIIWTPTNSTIAIPVHTNVDDIVDIIVVKAPSAPLMPGRFYLLNKGVDNYGKTRLFFFSPDICRNELLATSHAMLFSSGTIGPLGSQALWYPSPGGLLRSTFIRIIWMPSALLGI